MARAVTNTDRSIIRELQRNARMSYAELSRATGIPESTVRRRMDRLQQRGVIQFAMLAEPTKLGYELRAMIGLRVELQKLSAIAEHLRGMNEVTFAAFLTGNFDITIQVIVESQANLVDFLTQRLAPIEGIRTSETFVMPYVIKPMTSWVLPEAPSVSANGLDDATDADEAETVVGATTNGVATPAESDPPRRKRGRPRKNPLPVPVSKGDGEDRLVG